MQYSLILWIEKKRPNTNVKLKKQIDLLNGYKQKEPFFIEIEPTEGCNLGCSFCGLRGIREKGTTPWYFMTTEIAEKIALKIKQSGWKSRVTFSGHGEPTLNSQLLDIIKIFRHHLPNTIFSLITNGHGFANGNFNIREFLKELENLKFNDLVLDVYSENGDWTCLNNVPKYLERVKIIGVDKEPFNYYGKKLRIALYPLKTDSKSLRQMSNHCGAAAPLDYSKINVRCSIPFRQLFIRWDGNISLCCDDFRGQYKIGSILEYDDIESLWNNTAFQAARIKLFNKERTFKPCHGCNCFPIRAGLIPDMRGKDKDSIPPTTKLVEDIVKQCYDENGSTIIVKRKWEK